MILPRGIDDIAAASFDEIVAAYVAEGIDADAARYMAGVLKGDVPADEAFD